MLQVEPGELHVNESQSAECIFALGRPQVFPLAHGNAYFPEGQASDDE